MEKKHSIKDENFSFREKEDHLNKKRKKRALFE